MDDRAVNNGTNTDAARMRRVRAHKRGDHSLCTAKTCPDILAASAPPPPIVPPTRVDGRDVGSIEQATIAFVQALPYVEPDPRALLALVAIRLAQRVDETGAVPAAVRELRVLLLQLVEIPNGQSGVVDEVRLRHAQRRLDAMLATAG